jgi:hypothetical protein
MKPATHLLDEDGNHLPGCFPCKLKSISFAPSAMPTRHPEAARAAVKDPKLEKDREAYRRLRRNGEQPKHVGGSAELETKATSSAEVATGIIYDEPRDRCQFAEIFDEQPTQALINKNPDESLKDRIKQGA